MDFYKNRDYWKDAKIARVLSQYRAWSLRQGFKRKNQSLIQCYAKIALNEQR